MTILSRRAVLSAGAGLAAGLPRLARAQSAAAPGAGLTYAISMADIPLTTGQPDRGAGAYQFTGLTLYDPLVAWELDISNRPGKLIPGLATSWESDPADRRHWVFHLREGVAFHDGSLLDADAVVWNFDKVLNAESPHFDNRQAAQVRPRLPSVASWSKLGPMTVQVTTKAVDALLPPSSAARGRSSRSPRRAPGRSSCRRWCHAPRSNWCAMMPIGTRRAWPAARS